MLQAVCAFIRHPDTGLILAVSRKDDHTKFGLPGGKIDPGETPRQAVIREVFEETGLVFSNVCPVFQRICEGGKDGVAYQATTFIGDIAGDISTSESGVVKWVTEAILLEGPFGRYNAALFENMRGLHV